MTFSMLVWGGARRDGTPLPGPRQGTVALVHVLFFFFGNGSSTHSLRPPLFMWCAKGEVLA